MLRKLLICMIFSSITPLVSHAMEQDVKRDKTSPVPAHAPRSIKDVRAAHVSSEETFTGVVNREDSSSNYPAGNCKIQASYCTTGNLTFYTATFWCYCDWKKEGHGAIGTHRSKALFKAIKKLYSPSGVASDSKITFGDFQMQVSSIEKTERKTVRLDGVLPDGSHLHFEEEIEILKDKSERTLSSGVIPSPWAKARADAPADWARPCTPQEIEIMKTAYYESQREKKTSDKNISAFANQAERTEFENPKIKIKRCS